MEHLKDLGVIEVANLGSDDMEEERSHGSPTCPSANNGLEQKMEMLMWKMNMVILFSACVVVGIVLMYGGLK